MLDVYKVGDAMTITCKFTNLDDESQVLEYKIPKSSFPKREEESIQKEIGESWVLSDRLEEYIASFDEIEATQRARKEFGYGYGANLIEITEENIKALREGKHLAFFDGEYSHFIRLKNEKMD